MGQVRVLIVEDKEGHLADARFEISRRQEAGLDVQADYASSLGGSREKFNGHEVILSDVFFPRGNNDPREVQNLAGILRPTLGWISASDEHYDAINEWMYRGGEAPFGVLLAEDLSCFTSFVFCTDTYHHGVKTEPVSQYAQSKEIPFIDIEEEGSQKNWAEAYRAGVLPLFEKELGERLRRGELREEELMELMQQYFLEEEISPEWGEIGEYLGRVGSAYRNGLSRCVSERDSENDFDL